MDASDTRLTPPRLPRLQLFNAQRAYWTGGLPLQTGNDCGPVLISNWLYNMSTPHGEIDKADRFGSHLMRPLRDLATSGLAISGSQLLFLTLALYCSAWGGRASARFVPPERAAQAPSRAAPVPLFLAYWLAVQVITRR